MGPFLAAPDVPAVARRFAAAAAGCCIVAPAAPRRESLSIRKACVAGHGTLALAG